MPELAFIEFLRPLSVCSSRYEAAARALARQLGQPGSESVGLTLPIGLLGHTIAEYRVEVAGKTSTQSDIDLDAIVGPLAAIPMKSRFEELTQGTIYVALDDGESEPVATPLTHWLAADLAAAKDRVVYQHGTFYEVTAAYRKMLRNEVRRLIKASHPWKLPPWRAGVHERKYNESVGRRSGWVNLDRHLHRGPTHPKGIEICDLVAPDGALVCVKRADDSAVLSHLFNQAVVAAEALRDGDEVRGWLHDRLPADRRDLVPRSPHFVFAVQLPRSLTPDSLFTFSQATLHRAAKHLERMGMAVSVVDIERGARGRAVGRTR